MEMKESKVFIRRYEGVKGEHDQTAIRFNGRDDKRKFNLTCNRT